MRNSEQLERETEQTRAEISATLDELRARLSPGQVLDQLLDYASDSSGGTFYRNLRQQVVANPLPVSLVGLGLAWLGMSSRRGSNADDMSGVRNSSRGGFAGDTSATSLSNMTSRGSDAYHAAADTLGGSARGAKESFSATAGSAADFASETYNAGSEKLRRVGDSMKAAADRISGNVAGNGRAFATFLHEQPLALVGIGVALGAMIGAALPRTRTENELMGQRSDALKQETADLVPKEEGKEPEDRAWQDSGTERRMQDSGTESAMREMADGQFAAVDWREASRDLSSSPESNEASLVPSPELDHQPALTKPREDVP
jgi:ElaB/YqjD/DUF883 family membrane-anchored ribosome-binding protein